MGIGIPELILIALVLLIPLGIIALVVMYLRRQTKLREEQNRLLQQIADQSK